MTMRPIEVGEMIAFSSGDYSDYSVNWLARALVRLDPDTLRADYMREMSQSPDPLIRTDKFRADGFFLWLSGKNFIEEVTYIEINTDYCSRLEDEWPVMPKSQGDS